ncbi:SGNH/GDSL hydrolase family protein [Actinopolymorpha sp. B17G11]|uniref:SGNH/GDSL hydrolase family protein n=1 Tax=unclassified Actinopolymorpha TaxID=2627063 RepID=UPI0032D913F1
MTCATRELRYVALGDSLTLGIGDLTTSGWRGWAALLAESLTSTYDLTFHNLAQAGATTTHVRDRQLPEALALRPQLASVIVGVNDTMRSSFDADRVRADLFGTAEKLTRAGADLLMVRFHDHSRVFGLPRLLAGPLARRIEAVNGVYDEIHAAFGGAYIDLAASPAVYAREAWSVDRLHPSELGHRLLARTCAEGLGAVGVRSSPTGVERGGGIALSRRAELAWLATKGVPWLGRRTRDLAPWAARLAVGEVAAVLRRRGAPATSRS